jgi:predicted short-subunit dehydrogenase-like oxidoreductase (DUF2520 family)
MTMNGCAVIGTGKLGTTLAHALVKKGFDLRALTGRTMLSARQAARIAGRGKPGTDIAKASRAADTIFLCVPDDAIGRTAAILAKSRTDWRKKTVFHMSGLVPSCALAPLAKKGASVASFHPVQAFARREARPDLFRGIFFGIEGDPDAVKTARAIARKLGGSVLILSPADKPFYHAACVFAAGGVTAVLEAGISLLEKQGLGPAEAATVLLPLAQTSLRNVKEIGAPAALTGPFVRGDFGTVSKHLDALRSDRRLDALYRSIALAGLDIAKKKGVPAATIRTLKKILEGG